MDCKEAKKMIPLFMNETIRDTRAVAFLKHIKHCESCYEELEMACLSGLVDDNLNRGKEEYDLNHEVHRRIYQEKKHLWVSLALLIADILIASLIIIVLILVIHGIL